jgi:AraC-like DNA-binding protein
MSHTSVAAVRDDWMYEAARQSQQILCDLRVNTCDADGVKEALARLPTAATPLEGLIRQGLIFEVLLGCANDDWSSRDDRTLRLFRRLLNTRGRASALLDSPASRAASLIRCQSTDPINVGKIARAVGCEQTHLRRAFRARFGISMRDFHTRCRVAAAIAMFGRGDRKTAGIARCVGYRSEKNFYRALRDVTGKRPNELKAMPQEILVQLARQLLAGFDCLST